MKTEIFCFGIKYKSKADLARKYNISYKTLDSRLRRGYTVEDAVLTTREETKRKSLDNFSQNHKILTEKEVRKRFEKYGYKIIEYTYKNNRTNILCYDKNGYRVYMNLANAPKNNAQIFSVSCNMDNFIYNANLYAKLHNYNCAIIDLKIGTFNQPDILCKCKCGEQYWCKFNTWKYYGLSECPTCRKTLSRYEELVAEFLKNNHIKFEREYRFNDCRNILPLPFDFYLPEHNCCIEVDGEQHFEENKNHFYSFYGKDGVEKSFAKRVALDKIKTNYCLQNNIKLIRVSYKEFKKDKKFEKIILSQLFYHQ